MTEPTGFRIRHGLPLRQRAKAAGLVWDAFGLQIAPGLSPRAGCALVRRALQGPRILVALGDGGETLLGLAGLRGPQGGLLELRPAVMRQVMGRLRATLRLTRIRLPAGGSADLVLDGLVVAPGARRRGVARALIRAAAAVAAARGHPGLRAEVAGDNHAAQQLYRTLGFVETPGMWRWSRRPLVMRLPLSPGPPSGQALSAASRPPAPAG